MRPRRCSAPDATTRGLAASSVMLGLVWEVLTHRRIETTLVYPLARSQLLYRLRLKSVVQSRYLTRQGIDEHLCRMELPPGGVRITDSAKCSPQLIDQHGPGDGRISAQLGLCDDRRHSSEVSHRSSIRRGLTGSVLRRSTKYVWLLARSCGRPPMRSATL
jgi:hypothetical protein